MESEKAKKIAQMSMKKFDVLQVIEELKQNQEMAKVDYEHLTKSADEYAEKTGATGNLLQNQILSVELAKEKKALLDNLQNKLDEKLTL